MYTAMPSVLSEVILYALPTIAPLQRAVRLKSARPYSLTQLLYITFTETGNRGEVYG